MASIPQTKPQVLSVKPRYGALPDGTPVEPIAHPLYSTAFVPAGALPSEINFFQYGIGDYVPGSTIVAKSWHTNMDQGGRLAAPRHHLITGVRVYAQTLIVSTAGAITIAATNASAAAGYTADSVFEDVVFLTQCGVLQIDHNNKTIVEQPVALAPGNYGLTGIVNIDLDASTGNAQIQASVPGSSGLPQTFGNRAFLLKPNEQFECKISYPQVRQNGSGSTTMQVQATGRYLTVILDGQSIRARR